MFGFPPVMRDARRSTGLPVVRRPRTGVGKPGHMQPGPHGCPGAASYAALRADWRAGSPNSFWAFRPKMLRF